MEVLIYTPGVGISRVHVLDEGPDPAIRAERLAWAESRWKLRSSLRRAGLIGDADGRRGPGR
jgi:hypothetical protein